MIKGYVIKRHNKDYVIECDEKGDGGYNVVPKELDPWNVHTIEEVEAYLIEHPEMLLDTDGVATGKLKTHVRGKRDSLLKGEVDGMNPMRWETLTEVQKQAWRDYRLALLDVPAQAGYPTTIVWPEEPVSNIS